MEGRGRVGGIASLLFFLSMFGNRIRKSPVSLNVFVPFNSLESSEMALGNVFSGTRLYLDNEVRRNYILHKTSVPTEALLLSIMKPKMDKLRYEIMKTQRKYIIWFNSQLWWLLHGEIRASSPVSIS